MKFWVWELDGEKPEEATYEGRKETDAAIAFVRERGAYLNEYKDEWLLRVDDDFGHRYEFRVRVSMEPRFTVDSIDK